MSGKIEGLPDKEMIKIWRNYMGRVIKENHFHSLSQYLFLDGIPRTIEQARLISSFIEVVCVIFLEAKDKAPLIERLKLRASLQNRIDDSREEVLHKRMDVYEKETLELLSYYPKSIIKTFNSLQKPLEVLRDILNELAASLSH